MVRTSGLIPDWGAKIPHALRPKNNNRSSVITHSIKTFKKWSTSKKSLFKKLHDKSAIFQ